MTRINLRKLTLYWYLALVAALTIGLDQFTKRVIVSNLALGERWMPLDWLAPVLTITHVRNTGAAFGIFPGGGLVFTVIGIIVVGAILYYYYQMPAGQWLVRTALGLQLGGALGNLSDRIRQGYVTDFINVEYWPVFNVADSSIVVGVAILVLVMLVEERQEARLKAGGGPDEPGSPEVERDMMSGMERPDSTVL